MVNSRIIPLFGLAGMVLLATLCLMPIIISMVLAFFPIIFIINTSDLGNALPFLLLLGSLACLLAGIKEKGKSKI